MSDLQAETFADDEIIRPELEDAGESVFADLEPVPPLYGCTGIVAALVFWQVLSKLLSLCGLPKAIQRQERDREDGAWQWRNFVVSWVHALLVGVWALLCFYWYPEMLKDLVTHHTPFSFAMVTFSTGYFLHDSIDIVVNKKVKSQWEVCLHHIMVGYGFLYNVIYTHTIGFTCVCLLAEVNAVFLHMRKLLQMVKCPFDHWLYRLNIYLNMVTFFPFRFGPAFTITWGLNVYGHRISPLYYYLMCIFTVIMTVIYVVLLFRLVKNDILRPLISRRKAGRKLHSDTCISKKNE